jgi:hypothetical protein
LGKIFCGETIQQNKKVVHGLTNVNTKNGNKYLKVGLSKGRIVSLYWSQIG